MAGYVYIVGITREVKCCYSKLIGYTRGAVTIKGAVIYQSLRYYN